MHYTKSGALDMRYSSSKAAVSSGYGGSSSSSGNGGGSSSGYRAPASSGYGGGSSSYGSQSAYGSSSYSTPASGSSSASSNLHYKKDNTLDMRYASSKAAVSTGSGYGGSSSGYGGVSSNQGSQSAYGSSSNSYPAYGSSSSASSSLHYKKDNTLDMRYASSKAAVSSGYGDLFYEYGDSSNQGSQSAYGSSSNSYPAYGSSSASSNLHYKKDGSLDMRHSSSKAAVGQGSSAAVVGSVSSSSSDGLHYTKDGRLDMRYASSKEVAGLTSGVRALQVASPGSELHLTKKGKPDMRYKSSKEMASSGKLGLYNIPDSVPTKIDRTPDMRKKEAKDFVKQQADEYAKRGILPNWVPRKKDDTIDASTAIGRAFLQAAPCVRSDRQSTWCPDAKSRKDYWEEKAEDEDFQDYMRLERQEPMPLPPPAPLIFPQQSLSLRSASSSVSSSTSIPESVAKLDYWSIMFESESTGTLGKGAFGIVRKATWNGINVAVKVLHLTQLTRREKSDFEKEICILAALGQHPNLVLLHGYCTNPPCIVMELVERGSLSYLLHYCVDTAVEAKMTDGRVKKRLLYGTADGMRQLHAEKIVHGDLKPQNVLVTVDYIAKITDFGLSTLRGKTSSSVRSHESNDDDDEPRAGAVGGTSGYMAPELLDSISPPDFPIDVYSFGILFNELVSEEEPYSDQYANFAARGPFAAANYARQGKRPTVNKTMTPPPVENLIIQCWSQVPARRPTFERVLTTIEDAMFIIPDSVNPK